MSGTLDDELDAIAQSRTQLRTFGRRRTLPTNGDNAINTTTISNPREGLSDIDRDAEQDEMSDVVELERAGSVEGGRAEQREPAAAAASPPATGPHDAAVEEQRSATAPQTRVLADIDDFELDEEDEDEDCGREADDTPACAGDVPARDGAARTIDAEAPQSPAAPRPGAASELSPSPKQLTPASASGTARGGTSSLGADVDALVQSSRRLIHEARAVAPPRPDIPPQKPRAVEALLANIRARAMQIENANAPHLSADRCEPGGRVLLEDEEEDPSRKRDGAAALIVVDDTAPRAPKGSERGALKKQLKWSVEKAIADAAPPPPAAHASAGAPVVLAGMDKDSEPRPPVPEMLQWDTQGDSAGPREALRELSGSESDNLSPRPAMREGSEDAEGESQAGEPRDRNRDSRDASDVESVHSDDDEEVVMQDDGDIEEYFLRRMERGLGDGLIEEEAELSDDEEIGATAFGASKRQEVMDNSDDEAAERYDDINDDDLEGIDLGPVRDTRGAIRRNIKLFRDRVDADDQNEIRRIENALEYGFGRRGERRNDHLLDDEGDGGQRRRRRRRFGDESGDDSGDESGDDDESAAAGDASQVAPEDAEEAARVARYEEIMRKQRDLARMQEEERRRGRTILRSNSDLAGIHAKLEEARARREAETAEAVPERSAFPAARRIGTDDAPGTLARTASGTLRTMRDSLMPEFQNVRHSSGSGLRTRTRVGASAVGFTIGERPTPPSEAPVARDKGVKRAAANVSQQPAKVFRGTSMLVRALKRSKSA